MNDAKRNEPNGSIAALFAGVLWGALATAVVGTLYVDAALLAYAQIILSLPGALICWAIGQFACKSRYEYWELVGPWLPSITYLTGLAFHGGVGKSSVNALDEPFGAAWMYLGAFAVRGIVAQRNDKLGRWFGIGVFAITIATGVFVFLTTGQRKL